MNNLKRIIETITFFFLGVVMSFAQNIAVIPESGEVFIYQTLQDAIENASNGSAIYLPGGGFQINNNLIINKKISIIGRGYKANRNINDGCTTIAGNLWFNENSSGSSVMGCYITGDVNIGNDGSSVNNVVVKYCNMNSIQVRNATCEGTVVNQNYIRNGSALSRGTLFTNNIVHSVSSECGRVVNNLIVNRSSFKACIVSLNIFLGSQTLNSYDNITSFANMAKGDVGENPVNIGDIEWADLFMNYNNATISPASNFHFVEDYESLYKDYGVYGGTGFTEQPPMPFIQAKSIPDQTDASGNLTIKIRVNSGE